MSKEITEHTITTKGEERLLSRPFSYNQTKPIPENSSYQYTKENPKITKTTKTYFRQVIRQTGPDGEVTEKIIESGDPISESVIKFDNDKSFNTKVFEEGKMRHRYGKKIITESGEELVQEVDTGYVPTTLKIGDNRDLKDIIVSLPPGSSIIHKGFQSRFSANKCSIYGEPEKITGSEYQFYSNVSKTRVEADDDCDFTNQDSALNLNASDNKESIKNSFLNDNENHTDPIRSHINENTKYTSKTIIKQGNVKASPSHPLPKSLNTQSHTEDTIFHLIVLTDMVIISSTNGLKPYAALEYCEKDKVEACVCDNLEINNLTMKSPKRKSLMKSLSCVSQKDQTTKFNPDHSFILKFNKFKPVLVTEPIVLTVSDTKSRDEWIEAIMSKK